MIGPFLLVLPMVLVVRPIGAVYSSYLMIVRGPKPLMYGEIAAVVLMVGLILTVGRLGPLWVCGMVGVAFTVRALIYMWYVQRLDGVKVTAGLVRFLPIFAACIPMVLAVLGVRVGLLRMGIDKPAVSLGLEVVAGGLCFVGAVLLLARETSAGLHESGVRSPPPPAGFVVWSAGLFDPPDQAIPYPPLHEVRGSRRQWRGREPGHAGPAAPGRCAHQPRLGHRHRGVDPVELRHQPPVDVRRSPGRPGVAAAAWLQVPPGQPGRGRHPVRHLRRDERRCGCCCSAGSEAIDAYTAGTGDFVDRWILHPVREPPDVGRLVYLSQLFGIGGAMAWNYLLNFYWTWAEGGQDVRQDAPLELHKGLRDDALEDAPGHISRKQQTP